MPILCAGVDAALGSDTTAGAAEATTKAASERRGWCRAAMDRPKRRTRCPECWNPIQFLRMKTHCATCRGTGFLEGFYRGIPIQIAFDPNPKAAQSNLSGEIAVSDVRARMSNFPLVSPRDLIVQTDNNLRFTISKIDITKLPVLSTGRRCKSGSSHIVSQLLNLEELSPDDPKYSAITVGNDIKGFGNLTAKKTSMTSTQLRIISGFGSLDVNKMEIANG